MTDELLLHLRGVPRGQRNDIRPVRRLLAEGVDVRGVKGHPHVLAACELDVPAALELILAAGADPNVPNLLSATTYKDRRAELLVLLARAGFEPDTLSKGTTLFMELCRLGDLETARFLLDRGASVNVRGESTPLACAEESGNQVLVDLLLERGATPLRPSLDGDVARRLDDAERAVKANPDAPTRLAWAEVLADAGHLAAAASEVEALTRLGVAVPASLQAALTFESPVGVRWSFGTFSPRTEGVAPRVADERFPGARVTDGARLLSLVVALGTPCTHCDELGEQECTSCNGTGSYTSYLDPDHDVDCPPREPCWRCRGLKFVVAGTPPLGKGPCRHATVVDEFAMRGATLARCSACGLAALRWGKRSHDTHTQFACGVCGALECRCSSA